MDTTSVFAPIYKQQEQDDGTLVIYGKATGSDLDLDGQRCDPDWLARAMPEWFKIGNVRSQHDSKQAVGKATEHEIKDDGHYIRAHIVDPLAITKTKAGIFTGLSIGIAKPRLEKTKTEEWIRDGLISEVSLCDRPCLPTATFVMCKSAKPGMKNIEPGDYDHDRQLVKVAEYEEHERVKPESDFTVTLGERLPQEQRDKLSALTGESVEEKSLEITGDASKAVAALEETKDAIAGKTGLDVGDQWAAAVTDKSTAAEMAKHFEGLLPDDEARALWRQRYEWLRKEYSPDFDRDAAKTLVASVTKDASESTGVTVPPISPPEELDDIMSAKAAIALIAQLIQSEASEMVCAPNEDYDIQLLLEAVSALRCFIMREKGEPGGDGMIMLAADADLEKKAKYSAEQKRDMLAAGKAMKNPDGDPSYPIGDKEDLHNAILAVGRGSGDHDAIRAYIKKRASALGATDMIPEGWNKTVSVPLTKDAGDAPEAESGEGTTAEGADSSVVKTVEDSQEAPPAEATEAVEDAEKDSGQVDLHKAVEETLNKAFSGEEDNIIRKTMMAIVEAATESAAKSVTALTERLEKVEQMAAPGGPALRRTELERSQARKGDLEREVFKFKDLAKDTNDSVLRKGYLQKASSLEAEIARL